MILAPLCRGDATGHCKRCGQPVGRKEFRLCGRASTPQAVAAKPMGDRVEQLMQSLGITEDRYRAAKALFGLPPTCHCAARKEWLNNVSAWWRGQV